MGEQQSSIEVTATEASLTVDKIQQAVKRLAAASAKTIDQTIYQGFIGQYYGVGVVESLTPREHIHKIEEEIKAHNNKRKKR